MILSRGQVGRQRGGSLPVRHRYRRRVNVKFAAVDGVNLRGFHADTGELLWEDLVESVVGGVGSPDGGAYHPTYGGLIAVTKWIRSAESWAFASFAPFGSAVPRGAMPPDAGQLDTWELKVQHLAADSGEVVSQSSGTLAWAVTSLDPLVDPENVPPGNPSAGGNVVGAPWVSAAVLGECSGVLIQDDMSGGWGVLWSGAELNVDRIVIPPRAYPSSASYQVTAGSADGYAEQSVAFAADADAATVAAALETLAHVAAVTATGGPLGTSQMVLDVTWARSDLSFSSVDAVNTWVAPVESAVPEQHSADYQLIDADTLDVISFHRFPNHATGLGKNRVALMWPMGSGEVVSLYRFGQSYENIDEFPDQPNQLRLEVRSGSDLSAVLRFRILAADIGGPYVVPAAESVGIRAAQSQLVLSRSYVERSAFGQVVSLEPRRGVLLLDFALNVLANDYLPRSTVDGSRYEFAPVELRGGGVGEVVLQATTNEYNSLRVNSVSQYPLPDNVVVNATTVPDRVRRLSPMVNITDRDVAMNCEVQVADLSRVYFGGGHSNPVTVATEQHQGRTACTARYQRWSAVDGDEYTGIAGAPVGAVLRVRRRLIALGVPESFRVDDGGSTQWRMGLGTDAFGGPRVEDDRPRDAMTRWFDWDADFAEVDAELAARYGTYSTGAGTARTVRLDNVFWDGEPQPYVNHFHPLFQRGMHLLLDYPITIGGDFEADAAGAAGLAGIYSEDVWPEYTESPAGTPADGKTRAKAWDSRCGNNTTTWVVQFRDANSQITGGPLPVSNFVNQYVAAVNWSDGSVVWQRDFGESVATGAAVGCGVLLNHQGSHLVGFGQVVVPELAVPAE